MMNVVDVWLDTQYSVCYNVNYKDIMSSCDVLIMARCTVYTYVLVNSRHVGLGNHFSFDWVLESSNSDEPQQRSEPERCLIYLQRAFL